MPVVSLLLAFTLLDTACASPSSDVTTSQTADTRPAQDLAARRDATATQAAPKDEASCRALFGALDDLEEDQRNRAAQGLYDKCGTLATTESGAAALRRAVARGTSVAGAYLLLGRSSSQENVSALSKFADATAPVKLQPWMAPVPVSLPASVALLRMGQSNARERVLRAASGSLAEAVFLLNVLDDVEDAAALKAAAMLLADRREIPGGVPSHATPMRRVADLAVDMLTTRLKLELTFPLAPARRYSDAQLGEVGAAVAKALSNR